MNLHEQLHKIKSIMGLNESKILSEKLTNVETDVDFIYDTYFKNIVEYILNDKPVNEGLFQRIKTDTGILKDLMSIEAHKKNPCEIVIFDSGIYYNPIKKIISLTISPNAIIALENWGSYTNVLSKLDDEFIPIFKSDLSEYRIKGSIHHELVHWIDDTLNNKHIEKFVKKNLGKTIQDTPQLKNINANYFERQAQIHNIKQLHNQYIDQWDKMSFSEMIEKLPGINSFLKTMPNNIKIQWVQDIKKRMNREGLLGKKMR